MKFNTHSKSLFFILLAPAYILFFIIIMALAVMAGSIMWLMAFVALAVTVTGAWLLSHKTSLLQNIFGFLCFLALGGYLALVHFFESGPRYGPWIFDVYLGGAIILMALIALLYQIVSRHRLKANKNGPNHL